MCLGIHLYKPHNKTYNKFILWNIHSPAICVIWYLSPGTTWKVMPARLHTIVLCLTLDSHSATTWRNTWSFILWRIHISVLFVVNESYPWTITSDTWTVMLRTFHISVLCVIRKSSQETTYRELCLISTSMVGKRELFFFSETTTRNIQLW